MDTSRRSTTAEEEQEEAEDDTVKPPSEILNSDMAWMLVFEYRDNRTVRNTFYLMKAPGRQYSTTVNLLCRAIAISMHPKHVSRNGGKSWPWSKNVKSVHTVKDGYEHVMSIILRAFVPATAKMLSKPESEVEASDIVYYLYSSIPAMVKKEVHSAKTYAKGNVRTDGPSVKYRLGHYAVQLFKFLCSIFKGYALVDEQHRMNLLSAMQAQSSHESWDETSARVAAKLETLSDLLESDNARHNSNSKVRASETKERIPDRISALPKIIAEYDSWRRKNMVALSAISDTLMTIWSVAREWKAEGKEFANTFSARRPVPITLDEMIEFSHSAIVALSDRTRDTIRSASMFGHAVLRPHRRPQLFSNHSIATCGQVTTDYIIGRPGWSADWVSGVRAEKRRGFIPSQFAITSGFKNDDSMVHHGMVELPLLVINRIQHIYC